MSDVTGLQAYFGGLMALAILLYAILDGYDLGIGILLPRDQLQHRNTMIASIGPFWDANETWLVLAVGLLLIAFPSAYNLVLRELYIPATIMLLGLIMRGAAFDFRAKVSIDHQKRWDWVFKSGSLMTALAQGYMLGQYVTGFNSNLPSIGFSLLSAVGVAAAYSYIGATWLVMKTEGELQRQAARWARLCGRVAFVGVVLVCVVNLMISDDVFNKWFSFPAAGLLFHIPLLSLGLFFMNDRVLKRIPFEKDFGCWIPFAGVVGIFFVCFQGLAYSFYPYVVPGKLTMQEAASAPESLQFLLVGTVIVVPVIIAYTVLAYRIFRGKATQLKYY